MYGGNPPGQVFEMLFDARINSRAFLIRATLYYENAGQRFAAAAQDFSLNSSMQTHTLLFAANQAPASVGRTIGIEFDNGGELAGFGLNEIILTPKR